MYKVLVLMSTYNGEKYLSDQLDSLICQKDVKLDILIRDDGSSDNTCSIIKGYMDQHNSISLVEGTNVGASKSFLELIKMVNKKYDYYAFCDQDDVWLEDKLLHAVELLQKTDNTKPCLYYSGQVLVDGNLNFISNHILDLRRTVYANFIFNQMAGCTAVFNTVLLEKLKQYIPNTIYMHDAWVYKVCAVLNGNIVVDDVGYIYYRQHGKNTIGLSHGVKGKVAQLKAHLYNHPSDYAKELINGFNLEIDENWHEYLECLINHKKLKNKITLMTNRSISFRSLPVRLVFVLKVLFGIL